jgi:hypothetical protein
MLLELGKMGPGGGGQQGSELDEIPSVALLSVFWASISELATVVEEVAVAVLTATGAGLGAAGGETETGAGAGLGGVGAVAAGATEGGAEAGAGAGVGGAGADAAGATGGGTETGAGAGLGGAGAVAIGAGFSAFFSTTWGALALIPRISNSPCQKGKDAAAKAAATAIPPAIIFPLSLDGELFA